jgi:uncharacterized protein (DUF2062 family)
MAQRCHRDVRAAARLSHPPNTASHLEDFCYVCSPVSVTPADPDRTPRTFWQRRVLDPVVAQLTQGITPEKIALTIAIGSALALFPILGTTTLLCLLVGIVLRLNQPIIQAVNYLCTPIHLPLIWWMVRTGEWLFGEPHRPFKMRVLANLLWEEPMQFLRVFGTTGLHAIVVWAILAPFWALLFYHLLLPVLREMTRVRVSIVPKDSNSEPGGKDEPPPVP